MNLSVMAEGIETREQHAFLLEKGCEAGQGYLFNPPLVAEEAESVLLLADGAGAPPPGA